MTGPGEGKVRIDSNVSIQTIDKPIPISDAEVYIHVKGYLNARVTHLDIEHEILNIIIKPKTGQFLLITGFNEGLRIRFDKPISYHDKTLIGIEVKSSILNSILKPGEATRTWIGGKHGGIYIGFRREHVRKLEKLVAKLGFPVST
jgi:hypothetical protein